MEYKDYYKTLGVAKDAKADEIKRAYRKLARKYHPDVSKEANAEEKFKEVQEAYEVLKDDKKRAAYDQLGSNWQSGQEFRPPPNWQEYADFNPGSFNGEDLGDYSDFFASIFGHQYHGEGERGRRRSYKQRGRDEQAKILVSMEDAYHGAERTIQLQVPEVDANGQIKQQMRTLKINIPPGVVAGQQLRLAKQGSPGMGGAEPGDLYLEVGIQPHKLFTLQGKDVYLTLPIAPWEAALGAKVVVPTLGGAVDMKVSAGAQSGQKLRLKDRGMPGKPTGDQYVLLQIVTPPAHTDEQRALYEKMSQVMPFNPRANL